MEAPYRECPFCWEESVQTDDAVPMARSTIKTLVQVIEYFSQDIVECENCHVKLEVNHDGEWNGGWHNLTTIRPLKALPSPRPFDPWPWYDAKIELCP